MLSRSEIAFSRSSSVTSVTKYSLMMDHGAVIRLVIWLGISILRA